MQQVIALYLLGAMRRYRAYCVGVAIGESRNRFLIHLWVLFGIRFPGTNRVKGVEDGLLERGGWRIIGK